MGERASERPDEMRPDLEERPDPEGGDESGAASVEEQSEESFPASDPPSF